MGTIAQDQQMRLTGKAEEMHNLITNLTLSHKETRTELDDQVSDSKLKDKKLSQLEEDMQNSFHSQSQRIGAELDQAKGVMSQISQRSELAHTYFEGLGKGVKDMHFRLTGEEGLLSSKVGSGVAHLLPTVGPPSSARDRPLSAVGSRLRSAQNEAWKKKKK